MTWRIKSSLWSDENVERLRKGVEAGESYTLIARAIGQGCTRNAAIGKAKRMGVLRPAEPSAPRLRARAVPRKPYQNAGLAFGVGKTGFDFPRGPSKPPTPLRARAELSPTASLDTLTSRSCRFPIGDPQAPDFGFCGRLKSLEASYCDHHAAICLNGFGKPRTETQLAGDVKRRNTFARRAANALARTA